MSCDVYPLIPQFYIVKLGYTGVYLFLIQNIHCGYLLEPPKRGGSNVYPQCMFLVRHEYGIFSMDLEVGYKVFFLMVSCR